MMRITLLLALAITSCGTRKQEPTRNKAGPTEKGEKAPQSESTKTGDKDETAEKAGSNGAHEAESKGGKEHKEHEAEGTKVHLKSDEAAKMAGFEVVKAQSRPEGAGLVATASITFDATRSAVINARSAGVVRAIKVDVGAKVDRGTALAVIESAQVGADRSRLGGAMTHVQVAGANYKREAELQAKGISATKDLLAAQQELEAAKSEYASLTASLGVVGGNAGGGGYTLAAPIAGVVIRRAASIGKLVGVEETLFEVVDTSTMWAAIDVPEDQLGAVALGQPVVVTVDGLGDRQFLGTISYIAPEIDARTRTARARAALPNPDGALRANMFARTRIVTAAGKPTIVVPSKAIQRINDASTVFVRISDREYEARPVELGADDGAMVEVTSGLRGGEEVVTQGAFLLKSEMLKGSLKGDDD
jgi:cobalt-zinc-cadmium efflux system membrane fusion protein